MKTRSKQLLHTCALSFKSVLAVDDDYVRRRRRRRCCLAYSTRILSTRRQTVIRTKEKRAILSQTKRKRKAAHKYFTNAGTPSLIRRKDITAKSKMSALDSLSFFCPRMRIPSSVVKTSPWNRSSMPVTSISFTSVGKSIMQST